METLGVPGLGEAEERLVVWAVAAALRARARRREAYTEAQLERKGRDERRMALRYGEDVSPGRYRTYLLWRELEELANLAGLSDEMRRLVEMSARGYSVSEIARALGAPRTSVSSRLASACGRIRAARRRYPFADLYEVYDAATRR